MTTCDPAIAELTSAPGDAVSSRVVDVDGVPMSALLAEAPNPRAIVVALHGGAAKSSYYDCPNRPWFSLVRTAAAVGFTALALDRPGYGASHPYADIMTTSQRRVELAYAAIDAHLGSRPRGAGVFIMAHSAGCELAVRMAADARGTGLLGIELAGTGRHYHPVALDVLTARTSEQDRQPRRTGLGRLLWQPAGAYPDDTTHGADISSPSPAYEGVVGKTWPTDFPEVAARVRVPVRYTLGEHEMVWRSGSAGLTDVASLFTESPRVTVNEQADSGHNLSVGLSAMAYHLKVLAFVEECVLARATRADVQGELR